MKRFLVIFLLCTLGSLAAYPQSIQSLQKSIERSRSEINKANKLLQTNRSKEKDSKSRLALVNANITNRKKIVSDLEKQRVLLNREIDNNKKRIVELNTELNGMKKEYGDMMRFSYKNYLHNNILYYLFSSDSFEDLHRRVYYLKCYSKQRTKTARDIEGTTVEISRQVDSLQLREAELTRLRTQTNQELGELDKERKSYNTMLNNIVRQNKNLNATIQKEQKKIKDNEAHIKRLMQEEAKKMRQAQKTATKEQNEEVVRLSSVFAQNKGKLPPPVKNGTITEKHGTHAHPLYPRIQVNNRGVGYTIPNGEPIRAVFDGVVSTINVSPGLDNSIIIKHGEYFTVYTGLNVVNVKRGDNVKTGDVIGTIKTNEDVNTFNFGVWKQTVDLDPEQWIR